ncbi:hypothetical protein MKW94_000202, partial [Papaver nudicaule]|nr:hypothetical protein [Papaver nudicaule]
ILNIEANEITPELCTRVEKCISKGACDCLFSPVEKKDLRLLYRHTISNMVKRKRNNEEVNKEVVDCSGSISKKAKAPKVVWDPELSEKFEAAVEALGGLD